jgi:uncharacterized protein (TIGR02453 family)
MAYDVSYAKMIGGIMKDRSPITRFEGFSKKSSEFLREVRARNSKKWFEDHRGEYEEHLLQPLRTLVSSLSGAVIKIDGTIETSPAINRTISKIYRDIRFSKDKSLFRDEAWISFKRRMKERVTVPEFYFYMTPQSHEFGMGYYAADSASMNRFREAIAKNPGAFRKALSFEKNSAFKYERYEDRYKRTVKNDGPADLQYWFQLKSFCYRVKRKNGAKLYRAALSEEIAEVFSELAPLYGFLIKNTLK